MDGGGGPLLLHGVTGSGKTEVPAERSRPRARGRGSIVLVPEIALTPQLLGRLRARLGAGVAVWHSALTPAQRAAEHRRVREGEADVVLGARSAVFAPVARLGLVVVDEEHDPSYKQDSSPRYDARQVAAKRARAAGAAVVFGSATPRPEAWHALPRRTLPARADGSRLPAVEIVDMRTQGAGPVSRPLAAALHAAALRGEKAVVLASRRGFSLMALCRECGWIARCPHCDVALVHHEDPRRLACHHCGHEEPVPGVCPRCASTDIVRQGTGSQGVEAALARLVPGRPDRPDGRIQRLRARRGGPPPGRVLAPRSGHPPRDADGGQGPRPPRRDGGGAVDADAPLQHAGFRSEERAFALIVQLAGRAGRRGEPARVIVQAYEPAARAVQLGARHAVEEFLTGEVERRRAHDLPPFGHLVRVILDGDRPEAVVAAAAELAETMRSAAPAVGVLGPSPLHRLRGAHPPGAAAERARRVGGDGAAARRPRPARRGPAARRGARRRGRRSPGPGDDHGGRGPPARGRRRSGDGVAPPPRVRAGPSSMGKGSTETFRYACLRSIPVKESSSMPVPRLFDASSDPREQWVHVLATLLALGGPETRTALVEEISGEGPSRRGRHPGTRAAPAGGCRGLLGDVVARGAGWTFALKATQAFDAAEEKG